MFRKLLLATFTLLVITGIISSTSDNAHSNASGAPPGNSGSPADNKTCAQIGCHPGTASAIADIISSDVPSTGYVPGTTYTISATVTDPSIVKFGFEISPQSSTGTLLGTMAIINTTTTKFASTTNKYVTHKSSGTSFPGHTGNWSFLWTAPGSGTGDVTFYGAFNFSNNNGSSTGDVIHTSTLTVNEGFGVGIGETDDITTFNLFPNPVVNQVNINYTVEQQKRIVISLLNLSGQVVSVLKNEIATSGNYSQTFSMEQYPKGIYLLEIKSGDYNTTRKIIKM